MCDPFFPRKNKAAQIPSCTSCHCAKIRTGIIFYLLFFVRTNVQLFSGTGWTKLPPLRRRRSGTWSPPQLIQDQVRKWRENEKPAYVDMACVVVGFLHSRNTIRFNPSWLGVACRLIRRVPAPGWASPHYRPSAPVNHSVGPAGRLQGNRTPDPCITPLMLPQLVCMSAEAIGPCQSAGSVSSEVKQTILDLGVSGVCSNWS